MWKILTLFLYILTMALPLSAQESATIEVNGQQHSYFYTLPTTLADENAPLVIVLHGSGMNGLEMQLIMGFEELAEASGAIVAYPNGIGGGWNYLDQDQLHPDDIFIDDVAFLDALVDQFETDYHINPDQVFYMGYSNGGKMALRMACTEPDKIAGVAVLAATLDNRLIEHCQAAGTAPLLLIWGTRDHAFPWQGSATLRDDQYLRISFSASQTMQYLTGINHCINGSDFSDITGEDSEGQIFSESYADCAAGKSVRLLAMPEATHDFPFAARYLLSDGSTGTIGDIIWDFYTQVEAAMP